VTVQLEPESLGKVHVVLSREAGGVLAHFRVETVQAHQALQGDLPQLRQVLESRGVPLTEVFVELDHGEARGQEQDRWGGFDGRRRFGSGRRLVEPADDSDLRSTPATPWGFDARI
jgi:flagellar hook-length control protein FliK